MKTPALLCLVGLFGFTGPASLAAPWAPVAPEFPVLTAVPQADVRVFINLDRFSLLAESSGRFDAASVRSLFFTGGGYFQPWDFLRTGLLYRRQYGVRHDTDWIFSGTQWAWQDVNGRAEDVLTLDLTPRVALEFLPGRDWVAELRTRYEFNATVSLHTLLVRPGLRFFLREEGIPTWTFYAQFEMYLPLNYGRSLIYETWTYLGALRALTPWFQVGLYSALRSRNWGSSNFYTANTVPSSTYLTSDWSYLVGANLIFQIGL